MIIPAAPSLFNEAKAEWTKRGLLKSHILSGSRDITMLNTPRPFNRPFNTLPFL